MFGEIKVGRSDTYEKVVSVANPRCAPENNNPFTSFMDKVVHGDLQKYVTNNVTICPFRKVRRLLWKSNFKPFFCRESFKSTIFQFCQIQFQMF